MFLNSLVSNMTAKTGKSESKKSTDSAAKKDQHDREESKSQSKSSDPASEEMDMGEELDELLNMLEEEDLTDVDIEQAAGMIDEWQGVLSKSKDAQLKEVGASLKQLKKLVSSSKVKEEDLAEVLSQLGSQVDEYANNAERGFKTKLHRLGKALSGEGKELTKGADDEE
jgi:ABC-type transporter Mla subunit MlaD